MEQGCARAGDSPVVPMQGSEDYTLEQLANRICSRWDFPFHWIAWPPDVFALLSVVFQRSGVYRSLLSPIWRVDREWQRTTSKAAQKWFESVNTALEEESGEFQKALDQNDKDTVTLRSDGTIDAWYKLFSLTEAELKAVQSLCDRRDQNLSAFEVWQLEDPWADLHKIVRAQRAQPTLTKQIKECKQACWIAAAAVLDLKKYGGIVRMSDLRTFPGTFEPVPQPPYGYRKSGFSSSTIEQESASSEHVRDKYREQAILLHALARLHAIADEASANFGMLSNRSKKSAMYGFVGNLMLTARGSLSLVSKAWATVLPKMRTPQRGFTVRSLSHHLTCHTSEVEVMWRVTPLLNTPTNTLNVLTIPWPPEVRKVDFKPSNEIFESWRGFHYDPDILPTYKGEGKNVLQQDRRLRIPSICRMLRRLESQGTPPQVLVFPEAAITRAEFTALLSALRIEHQKSSNDKPGGLSELPIVIAGVRHSQEMVVDRFGQYLTPSKEAKRENSETGSAAGSGGRSGKKVFRNEVRLATYFAGKWYVLGQRKHHRWKLDTSQVRQYSLSGRLETGRDWFEDIQVGQRRLSVIAPNDWLSICPLICEDLAQLEPVSELIRGIGPTMLVSILMDGPQLPQRWAARYASVFADDPGTAVLSQTSLGMCTRSNQLIDGVVAPSKMRSRITTSWKDPKMGFRALSLGGSEGKPQGIAEGQEVPESDTPPHPDAILITARAMWNEEFTADERSDNYAAAALEYETARLCYFHESDDHNIHVAPKKPFHIGEKESREITDLMARYDKMIGEPTIGLWHEFREHSVALYILDALITVTSSLNDDVSRFTWWMTEKASEGYEKLRSQSKDGASGEPGRGRPLTCYPARYQQILKTVLAGLVEPGTQGIAFPKKTSDHKVANWPTKTASRIQELAAEANKQFLEILSSQKSSDSFTRSDYWGMLERFAREKLSEHSWVRGKTIGIMDPFDDGWTKKSDSERRRSVIEWNNARLERAIYLSIIVLLHYRLDRLRGDHPVQHAWHTKDSLFGDNGLTFRKAEELIERLESTYKKYRV